MQAAIRRCSTYLQHLNFFLDFCESILFCDRQRYNLHSDNVRCYRVNRLVYRAVRSSTELLS